LVLLKLAPSGTMIRKGDLLASIDGQSLQDHIDDVKDTVETAEADVRKRKAELEIDWKNMQLTVAVAKADLEKARLDARAAEVRTEVERMLLQLNSEEADARYKQVQSDIENTRKRQAAELRILELTLERHKRHLGRHVNDIKRFSIHSPIDGLVVYQSMWGGSSMRQIEVGDNVSPGQPFI
jgi:multidrug resistance efflux pump